MSMNLALSGWVEDVARLTKPDSIHWCTGAQDEYDQLIEAMLREDQTTRPN